MRLRRALAAYLLFNIGEWANWIALLVWAYSEAGVRGASVIAVVQLVPAALLASVSAAWLGRMPAPRALRLGYAAQAASAATLGTAILLDASFGLVCVLALPITVSVTMTRPVHHTLLPEVSATTGELTAANAASGWVEAAAIFLGPLASGAIAAWWHPGGVLVVMATGSAVALLCTIGLGPGVPRVVVVAEDARPTAALRAVVRHPAARLISGLVAAEWAMLGMLDILLVVLAFDLLDLSTAGPGLLNSALGLGGLLGAGLAFVLIGAQRLSPALVAGAVATGVPFALAGLSRSAWLAMALIAVCGAGKLFFDVAVADLHPTAPARPAAHRGLRDPGGHHDGRPGRGFGDGIGAGEHRRPDGVVRRHGPVPACGRRWPPGRLCVGSTPTRPCRRTASRCCASSPCSPCWPRE